MTERKLNPFRDPLSNGRDDPENALIESIVHFDNQEVCLRGWVQNLRSSGKVAFLQLRDGTGVIQCVASPKDVGEEVFSKIRGLSLETSVVLRGLVKKDDRSKIGFELVLSQLEVLHSTVDYPIGKKEHGVAFLMQHRHLWLRSSKQVALMRLRAELIKAIRDYFDSKAFRLVDSPILTPNACEGTSTLFETPYFDSVAYLTQSGQLYAEASALACGKVYCFGPTFRAEKSKTRRHLAEFWMVEPEVAFMDLQGDMDLAEDFIESIVQRCVQNCPHELATLERSVSALEKIKKPFPRIRYEEAIEILIKKKFPVKFGDDFGGDEETAISEEFDRPVIIHRYPKSIKAFYMREDPEDDRLALCMDVIAPEGVGEIIGGSERESDLSVLEKKIQEHNLSKDAFEWYLDLRRFGSVPHSGFGLGLERTLGWIAGVPHVRECVPFPRMMDKIWP
ncbi:MAG: asparagine--tRNA ligase [Bradymonadales bacterium]|nr:MAG: asparagine--tRNA ligase [Bradymonadales bacterium]